jgi:hypothetical protein
VANALLHPLLGIGVAILFLPFILQHREAFAGVWGTGVLMLLGLAATFGIYLVFVGMTRPHSIAFYVHVGLAITSVFFLLQTVHSGSRYCSQSELTLTFGLGKATQADSVEITWPSGEQDTLRSLRANLHRRRRRKDSCHQAVYALNGKACLWLSEYRKRDDSDPAFLDDGEFTGPLHRSFQYRNRSLPNNAGRYAGRCLSVNFHDTYR